MSPPGDDDPPAADESQGTDAPSSPGPSGDEDDHSPSEESPRDGDDSLSDQSLDDDDSTPAFTDDDTVPGSESAGGPGPSDQRSSPGPDSRTASTANREALDSSGTGTQSRLGGGSSDPPAETGTGDSMDWSTFLYDIVSSALAVLLVGAFLFAVSGVWPPMVAVESPSMTPHMKTGDLVFVMDEERFPGDGATGDTGVVTARTGETTDADYPKFQRQGDVIVYEPDGNGRTTPIIHRAMFWVDEGENWYDEADKQAIGRYSECGETPDEALPNCPAPYAGFITKGDANSRYDQVDQLSGPVKAEWIIGTAEVRVPKLGCVRLRTDGCLGGVGAVPGNDGFHTRNRTALVP